MCHSDETSSTVASPSSSPRSREQVQRVAGVGEGGVRPGLDEQVGLGDAELAGQVGHAGGLGPGEGQDAAAGDQQPRDVPLPVQPDALMRPPGQVLLVRRAEDHRQVRPDRLLAHEQQLGDLVVGHRIAPQDGPGRDQGSR